MDGNFSLADFATLANANNGNMGGSFWFIILFFLICNNGWNNGWNRNGGDYGQFATAASQQDILFSSKFQALDNKIDRIGNGIADATFSLNNSVKDGVYTTTNAVKDTAYATSSAVVGEGRALATQLAQCCCDNKQATAQVRYDMANFAASINSNIDNKFAALEKSQLEQRLADQASQINQLQMAQALCGVPKISPNAWGVYAYPQPTCGCNCNRNI